RKKQAEPRTPDEVRGTSLRRSRISSGLRFTANHQTFRARKKRAGSKPALFILAYEGSGLTFRKEEPGVQYGVGVQRDAFDALLHQPLGQVRVVGRALAADADVLASLVAGGNGIGQQLLHGRVT